MTLRAALLLLLVTLPAVQAQDTEDLAAVEARLSARLGNMTAELARSQAALDNLSLTAAQNQARLLVLLDLLQDGLDQAQSKIGASNATMRGLASNYTQLRLDLDRVELAVQLGRNESFEDNLQIYNALVGSDRSPILPAFDAEVQRIIDAQFKLRSDLDALNSNVTDGINALNDGNEAIFGVTGQSQSSDRIQLILLIVLAVSQLVTLSFATKRPRRLWRRLQYEADRTQERGRFVNPPCPKESEGLRFGQAFQCPHLGTCPIGQECKTAAIQETTDQATRAPELAPAPERLTAPQPATIPERPVSSDPLAGFGGAHA